MDDSKVAHSIIFAVVLLFQNCCVVSLATGNNAPPNSNHRTTSLSIIINELQDAVLKLKEYAYNIGNVASNSKDNADRELSPELEGQRKSIGESIGKSIGKSIGASSEYIDKSSESKINGRKTEKDSKTQQGNSDQRVSHTDANDISLKDALMYLANLGKLARRQQDTNDEPIAEKPEKDNRQEQRDEPLNEDDSYPELVPELERYSKDIDDRSVESNKDGRTKETESKTGPIDDKIVSNIDSNDVSLKEALMYLVNLGKQLKQEQQKNDLENHRTEGHS